MAKPSINSAPVETQARVCGVSVEVYRVMLADDSFPAAGTLAAKRDWINANGSRFSVATAEPDAYDAHKERARARQARMATSGRDIAPMPPVVNPSRRTLGLLSFRAFLEIYFATTFWRAWSPDHLAVMAAMEHAMEHGGLYVFAMPRGNGKTSLCRAAVIYAVLKGWHKFVVLIGADAPAAEASLAAIKSEFETNELLMQDFPEVCYPIARLEGIANRANGQTLRGRRTSIAWKGDRIRLPTVQGSAASGAVIATCGITGGIRGMLEKLPGGRVVRPSLVLPDDPQTDASARSVTQTEDRLQTLQGAVLGLAGPGESITAFMPCTIIRPGDLADQALGGRFAEWQTKRTKLVLSWPDKAAEPLWEKYLELRRADVQAQRIDGAAESTKFYEANRAAMDAGAVVAWEARKENGELSALQHAYNLRSKMGDAAFAAELQNDPNPTAAAVGTLRILPEHVPATRARPGALLPAAELLAIHIDVHDKLLYWAACCGDKTYRAVAFPDWGTYPDQGPGTWTMGSVKRTIRRAHQNLEPEAALQAAIVTLIRELAARDWPVAETGESRVADLILVDERYLPAVVAAAIKEAGLSHVKASRGRGISASNKPFAEYKKERGDTVGDHWMIQVPERRKPPVVQFDANYWKSALARRFHLPVEDAAHPAVPGGHVHFHSFVAHLAGEYGAPIQNMVYGRTVHEWKPQPGAGEHHWLDTAYNAFAGLAVLGASLAPATEVAAKKREKPRYTGVEI